MSTAALPKAKTKAKSRYLKAKKDRRKQRKSVNGTNVRPSESLGAVQHPTDHGEPPGGKRKRPDDQNNRSTQNETELTRPSKRARVHESPAEDAETDQTEASESDGHEDTVDEETDEEASDKVTELESAVPQASGTGAQVADELPSHTRRSPTPPSALQAFPLPEQPPPPDPSVLARQGLDRALLEAETVDASRLLGLDSDDASLGLSDTMKRRLKDLGITELFAVQTALLPYLLTSRDARRELYCPYDPPRDVCVSAPTGSGKTLAYAVPIVEILAPRIVTRLRALIVLPTRDLASQVRETFEALSKGRGLKIATVTGAQSFKHEQKQLVAEIQTELQGGSSKVDVLICTPGRLIDHLASTPNFTLQHLRFLVVDEADRLLTQSYQDWLPRVLSALQPPSGGLTQKQKELVSRDGALPLHDSVAPAWIAMDRQAGDKKTYLSCQKMLFSATLTRDPGRIAALKLRRAKYFMVRDVPKAGDGKETDVITGEHFAVPATLSEHMLVCSADTKPLHLFDLIHNHDVRNALIFTKSAESTSRLVKMLEFFEESWSSGGAGRQGVVASAYSSDLAPGERRSILDKFRKGFISILVASDLISRGIDISHVSHVVNYDAPIDMRKYVHRAGRTARAGRSGDAWSLVEEQEARHFKAMLSSGGHIGKVKRLKVTEEALALLKPHYEVALERLKQVYAKDARR